MIIYIFFFNGVGRLGGGDSLKPAHDTGPGRGLQMIRSFLIISSLSVTPFLSNQSHYLLSLLFLSCHSSLDFLSNSSFHQSILQLYFLFVSFLALSKLYDSISSITSFSALLYPTISISRAPLLFLRLPWSRSLCCHKPFIISPFLP